MKPIAQHNGEMAAHSRQWFAPDAGKIAQLFVFNPEKDCWIASRSTIEPQENFLNYDGKIELMPRPEGGSVPIKRRDMTEAEFSALPFAP